MINKHLFLSPELLSRLCFSQPSSDVYYVQATPNQKPMRARPEEIIRQLFILSLIHQYYYPEQRIKVEYPVQMGRTKKRADIVVLGENGGVDMVIEVKQKIDHESMEQLKSYVMVTGATYGAAVSGYEFICLKKDTSNCFVELEDLPICGGSGDVFGKAHLPDNSLNDSSTASLRMSLRIEHLEKISQSHAKITIQGRSLKLSIVDLASYKKTQKHFLSIGVILTADIKQSVWLSFVSELLAIAPDPPARALVEDAWKTRIATWINNLSPEQDFLTSRSVFVEVLSGLVKKFDRSATIRIAGIMRSLGWRAGTKRIRGRTTRGYFRAKQQE